MWDPPSFVVQKISISSSSTDLNAHLPGGWPRAPWPQSRGAGGGPVGEPRRTIRASAVPRRMRTTGSVASPMTSCTPSSVRSRSSTPLAPARSPALSAVPALTAFTTPPRMSPSPQSMPRVTAGQTARGGEGEESEERAWTRRLGGRLAASSGAAPSLWEAGLPLPPRGASTGGRTTSGRSPEGRPRATTERRVATTRWMEQPQRDALKREYGD
jgi:hypothetical protein